MKPEFEKNTGKPTQSFTLKMIKRTNVHSLPQPGTIILGLRYAIHQKLW